MFALPNWPQKYFSKMCLKTPCLFVVYNFSYTVEHKVNTQALELSEPTMNTTEMTTERYEHPLWLEVFLHYISIIRSYLNFIIIIIIIIIISS